jgi:hypothetical protein
MAGAFMPEAPSDAPEELCTTSRPPSSWIHLHTYELSSARVYSVYLHLSDAITENLTPESTSTYMHKHLCRARLVVKFLHNQKDSAYNSQTFRKNLHGNRHLHLEQRDWYARVTQHL